MSETKKDTYLVGYGEAARAWIEHRTAQSHAAFFLPFLKKGMSLLDVGCGPGSITIGLAGAVAPGLVTAIDIEPSQLERATARSKEAGLSNITFEEANIFELPYKDNMFDAVFLSAVLSNLQRPQEAMEEIKRVLKPGGMAGFSEFDSGGDLYYPQSPEIERSSALYFRLREHIGDDPCGGRRLKALLNGAGFSDVSVSATYEVFDPKQYAFAAATQFRDDFGQTMLHQGWTTEEEIAEIVAAWQALAEHPDAFVAATWVQAIGRKD